MDETRGAARNGEDNDEIAPSTPKSESRNGCVRWLQVVTTRVYVAHAITTWGDRMWAFAISLFLLKLSSESAKLRLPAIFGFVSCCLMAISGAAVGRWVDRTPRMKAAVRSLVVQNSLVLASAVVLCITMYRLDELQAEENYWILLSVQVSVIALGSAAYVASLGSTISISQDWVKVIAMKDSDRLADINANCKRIDLVTKLCSPAVVGNLMALISYVAAAVFIASWNIVSMVLEYLLLRSVYKQVPDLAIKSAKAVESIPTEPEVLESLTANPADDHPDERSVTVSARLGKFVSDFISPWQTYWRHKVFPAGLGLACLYMTVLALDGILIGFAYSQGLSEYILGTLGGIGALVGIIGTLVYPVLRRRVGIERTGLIGFFLETCSLTFCVASIFAPGSPFDPGYLQGSEGTLGHKAYGNESSWNNETELAEHNITMEPDGVPHRNYTSVILLIVGCVAARCGLWIVDLTVNQILQEEVAEREIGTISGVQHSLNMTMDLIRYVLVVLLPAPETFGYLIMASFTSILLGWASFAVYSKRKRHHILPFHRFFNCYAAANNVPRLQTTETESKPCKPTEHSLTNETVTQL